MAGLDDEDGCGLLLLAGLLTFGVTPWGKKVLTTTTGLGFALTTTVRVVNRVHAHAADGRADTLPASAACFSGNLVHVIAVTDGTDGAVAVFVEATEFTRRHFHEVPTTVAGSEHCGLSCGAGNFATVTGKELDVVDFRGKGHFADWHCVTEFRSNIFTGYDLSSVGKTGRGEDIGFYTVLILEKGNAAGAVRIVFDSNYSCFDVTLIAFEIDQAIMALVTTADVACGDASCVVPSTRAFKRGAEGLLRLAFSDFVKRRKLLVAAGWSGGLESFKWHDSMEVWSYGLGAKNSVLGALDEVEGFSGREADEGFLILGGAAFVCAALAADFSVVICSADFDYFLVEDGLNGLLDFELVGKAVHFENDLVVLLLEQGGFFAEADVFNDLVDVFHGRR